jgi:phasin family protein
MIAFGQGNVEALVKSGQIWAAGVQDLSKQLAATVQANLDETMGSFKAFSGVKSVKDAIDLQATFARTAMEKAMAETGRMTDASLKLAEQAMAPITARVTLAVETMVKPA